MKKNLLLMAVATLSCLGTQAQSWTEPEEPTSGKGTELISGNKYKIKNVAAYESENTDAAFLAGGASWYSWATSTVLAEQENALTFTLKEVFDADQTRKGWTLARTTDSKYTFISSANPANQAGLGEMHVDQGSQAENLRYFDFVKQNNGYYRIQASEYNSTYYNAEKWWGWSEEDSYPTAVYATVTEEEGYSLDWELIDMTRYEILVKMYGLLNEGIEVGMSEQNLANFSGMYENNAEYSVEELTKTCDDLKAYVASYKTQKVLDGASEENPIDGTELIENADFEAGNINGWVCTFVGGVSATNIGYQGASYTGKNWTDEETGETGTATLNKFIEAWANNVDGMKRDGKTFATIGDAKLYQTIFGLPAGKYKLSADVNAVQQYAGDQNPVTGVQLYATAGEFDFYKEMATDNGKPEHFILTFIHSGGDVELGLRTQSTTANWIAADNFKIMYYGEITKDPYQVILEDYIAGLEKKYPEMDDVKAEADVKAATAQAIDEAKEATSDFADVQEKLEEQVKLLEASIKLYEEGYKAIDEINDKMIVAESSFPDLAAELSEYYYTLKEKYDDCTATEDDFAGISDKINEIVANYVSENCKPGDDVTLLLKNPGFKTGFDGWTIGGAGVAWANNYAQGENSAEAAANMEAPAREDGLAEKWHAKFTMTQTIKNMPRGLYTLTCQGFNRHDDGEVDAAAELYAVLPDGSVQTAPFAGIDDYATDECLVVLPSDTQWAADVQNSAGKWVPNGMTASAWHFMNKSDGENYDYVSKFDIVMTEAGDLTMGARCEYEHQWVIFDNFRIIYQGSGANVYAGPIADKVAEGNKIIEKYEGDEEPYVAAGITKDVYKNWQDLTEKADDVASLSEDECIQLISDLTDAIADIKASGNAVLKLYEAWSYINETRALDFEASDELTDYLSTVEEALTDQTVASMEEVQAMIDKMNVLCGESAVENAEGYADASEDNPVDVSLAIENTNAVFEEAASSRGWSNAGGNIGTYMDADGVKSSCFEVYNQEKFDLTQKIGLKAGYYRLKVQGFHRNGFPGNVAAALNGETEMQYTIDEESGEKLDSTEVACTNKANAILYAGKAETALKTIDSEIEKYNAIEGIAGAEMEINDEKVLFPNSMEQAGWAFSEGLYWNVLQFQVGQSSSAKRQAKDAGSAADGINIGIKNIDHKNGDWTICTNWTLEYIGKDEPANDPTTAIVAVGANANGKDIFSITGIQQNKMQKGINLMRNNGKIVKVLVK